MHPYKNKKKDSSSPGVHENWTTCRNDSRSYPWSVFFYVDYRRVYTMIMHLPWKAITKEGYVTIAVCLTVMGMLLLM